MEISCLASSSSANCYIIKNKQHTLMVEAGLDLSTTKSRLASLNIKLSSIDGLLITHRHGDHCNLLTVGRIGTTCPVVANQDVIDYLRKTVGRSINAWHLKTDKPIDIGTFKIWAFDLDHDVPAYGFIIKDMTTSDKLLFINDTEYVRWNFKNAVFHEVMIECNHNYEKITNLEPYRKRSIKSHMELGATIKTLKSMNLSHTNNIYLMHLSDGYSDQEKMMNEVQAATGKPTYVCLKNGGFI
jgi:phosphoribosyl 1,2-cyclic phosphodiesterase